MESNIKLNLDINTKDLDKSITEEILKNVQCDIQELISDQYSTYLDNCEINGEIHDTKHSIADFHIDDKVMFLGNFDSNAKVDSRISIGSIGKVNNISSSPYPIGCKFNGFTEYFNPEELQIIK